MQNYVAGETLLVRAYRTGNRLALLKASLPCHWTYHTLVTDLSEGSLKRLIEVQRVSLCTEMKDEGGYKAVISNYIQACLGLLD